MKYLEQWGRMQANYLKEIAGMSADELRLKVHADASLDEVKTVMSVQRARDVIHQQVFVTLSPLEQGRICFVRGNIAEAQALYEKALMEGDYRAYYELALLTVKSDALLAEQYFVAAVKLIDPVDSEYIPDAIGDSPGTLPLKPLDRKTLSYDALMELCAEDVNKKFVYAQLGIDHNILNAFHDMLHTFVINRHYDDALAFLDRQETDDEDRLQEIKDWRLMIAIITGKIEQVSVLLEQLTYTEVLGLLFGCVIAEYLAAEDIIDVVKKIFCCSEEQSYAIIISYLETTGREYDTYPWIQKYLLIAIKKGYGIIFKHWISELLHAGNQHDQKVLYVCDTLVDQGYPSYGNYGEALYYFMRENTEDAERYYEEALNNRPDRLVCSFIFELQGRIAHGRKDDDRAIYSYKAAIDYGNDDAYGCWYRLLVEQGRIFEANIIRQLALMKNIPPHLFLSTEEGIEALN